MRHATVVVAEDDYALRSLITATLCRQGHAVLEASDGVELVRLLASREVDAVLLDVRLGADDGISLAHELRQMQADVPIALLSGDSSEADTMRRAVDLTDVFLSKPFTIPDLTATVSKLLDKRREARTR
jgi:DNA-binding response OmpR family regulator